MANGVTVLDGVIPPNSSSLAKAHQAYHMVLFGDFILWRRPFSYPSEDSLYEIRAGMVLVERAQILVDHAAISCVCHSSEDL